MRWHFPLLLLMVIFSLVSLTNLSRESLAESSLYELNGVIKVVDEEKYHYYIINATINLRLAVINTTHVKVYVNITGFLHQAGRLIRNQTILIFVVNTKNNHAWFNGMFIGFFPLYIFPAIGYANASDFSFIFLGKPLSLITCEGKPVPVHCHLMLSNGTKVSIVSLVLENKYCKVAFVYHYPIYAAFRLPLGGGKYLYITACVSGKYIRHILDINDYPENIVAKRPLLNIFVILVLLVIVCSIIIWRIIRGRRI
ncbi:MAG: hypothetical protein DRJ66_03830 [Thermoprotei archaeon]|nr:MAG: hypothetical protein DRJ66_03830 [Thermoprotei archaeon]